MPVRIRSTLRGTNQDLVTAAAAKYGVPADIALSVARTESGFSQSAVSPAGAIGIMQLMPATAAGLGVNPHDASQNVDGGVRYLSQLYQQFGDWSDAVMAYNAGPRRVSNWLQGLASLPAETVAYVGQVLGLAPSAPVAPVSAPVDTWTVSNDTSAGWDLASLGPDVGAEVAAAPAISTMALLAAGSVGALLLAWVANR